jgi:hypothetical protein
MTTATQHCGDSCGLIDFTMAVAGDRLLPEERMKLAIEAVTSGKMSQRGAAAKYGVARKTLGDHLARVGGFAHPAETQSTTEVPPDPVPATQPEKLKSGEVRSRLRALLRQHNAPKGIGGKDGISSPQARGWLHWAGIPIPPELNGAAIPFDPSATATAPTPAQKHDTESQRLPANHPVPSFPDGANEVDIPEDHPVYADNFDIDAVRERVNHDVQQSTRPADFKRAIELLTELDRICTDAWYRRHPEPWGPDDWAHVSSEIEALHSIVGQRAEETADDILRKGSAFTVSATALA